MACPACGCKETYQYDAGDAPDDDWERCAACGAVFHHDDHTPEDDDEPRTTRAASLADGGFPHTSSQGD